MNAQMKHYEPTEKEIQTRADYLKPLLLKSREDAGELLANQTGTPSWNEFAAALHDGDECEAGKLARAMLSLAVDEEAERLASNELYDWRNSNSQYYDIECLRRIGALEIHEWAAREGIA